MGAAAFSARVTCLASAPLFKGLAAPALEEIAAGARESRIPAKRPAFQEGEPVRDLALLTAGRMKLTQLAASGDVVILRFAVPGEVVSGPGLSVSSLQTTTAIALEQSDLLSWEARSFEALAERFPLLQRNSLRILAERVRDVEQRYRELATEKVAARLARTLLRLLGQMGRPSGDAVVISLSREELGQMIGATLFSVSRLLSQWEAQGIVAAAREAVIVKVPGGLVTIAEASEGDASAPAAGSPYAVRC
jgi:CRP-like cAMP-binding protein